MSMKKSIFRIISPMSCLKTNFLLTSRLLNKFIFFFFSFMFQVAWLRVDTQTILTIASHVITKNRRIGVSHSEHRTWFLHIREVRPTDRGGYMCQINTDPMKSQTGVLDVVGKQIIHSLNSFQLYLI